MKYDPANNLGRGSRAATGDDPGIRGSRSRSKPLEGNAGMRNVKEKKGEERWEVFLGLRQTRPLYALWAAIPGPDGRSTFLVHSALHT
jgi:hypothetical protein